MPINPPELLEQAAKTFRERGEEYGDYKVCMTVFSQLVTQRLGVHVSPSQCAGIMVDLKQTRLLYDPTHTDSAKDKIVYEAMCLALL